MPLFLIRGTFVYFIVDTALIFYGIGFIFFVFVSCSAVVNVVYLLSGQVDLFIYVFV